MLIISYSHTEEGEQHEDEATEHVTKKLKTSEGEPCRDPPENENDKDDVAVQMDVESSKDLSDAVPKLSTARSPEEPDEASEVVVD